MAQAVTEDAASGAKSRRRLVVTAVLGLALTVAIFAFLLPQASSYEAAFAELADIPRPWLAALVVAGILNLVVYPFTVLVAVPGLGYWHGFVERQSGFLVSNAVPGGGAVAVGTQFAILTHYRVPPALSAAAISADAVWTYLMTLGMPALGVALLVIEGRNASGMTTLALVGIIAFTVSLIAIIAILRSESGARRIAGWAEAIVGRLARVIRRQPPDVASSIVRFRNDAHDLVGSKWMTLTVTNVAAQLTPLAVLICALAAMDSIPEPLSLIEVFAAYSAAILLTSFPISPGGLGTVDGMLVLLLTQFGADGSVALAADMLWRLVWFLPQLLTGAICMAVYLIGVRRGKRDSSGAPHG